MNQEFLKRLKQGDLLIGTFMTLPSPEIAEIFVELGFDWLFVDMEHTTLNVGDVQRILQAVGDKCACVVRVPSSDEAWLKKVLDAGANGVIVPHISNADEVRHIVRTCLYPPEGSRSVGMSRAQKYGLRFNGYVESANRSVAIIPQIEHREGVENIEEILCVPGISAVFIGPYDLSGSLGKLGKTDDPQVRKNITVARDACIRAGIPVGIFCMDTVAASSSIEQGFTLISMGMDTLFVERSAQDALRKLRK